PTFECSGQVAPARVPKAPCWSLQVTLPSAAFGLIEKPSGRVTVAPRISDGEGVNGLCVWGTVRSTSRPDAASACTVPFGCPGCCVVVGVAVRLGLNASWSQPVVDGQGTSALRVLPV